MYDRFAFEKKIVCCPEMPQKGRKAKEATLHAWKDKSTQNMFKGMCKLSEETVTHVRIIGIINLEKRTLGLQSWVSL